MLANFYDIRHVNHYVLLSHAPLCLKSGSKELDSMGAVNRTRKAADRRLQRLDKNNLSDQTRIANTTWKNFKKFAMKAGYKESS